jgi:HD-like signal output (HDOD) protein
MVLADDLKAADGRLLLPRGLTLEQRHIELLKRLGVKEASARTVCEPEAEEAEAIADYVRDFFLYCNPDRPVVLELFRIALDRTAAAVCGGWELPDTSERRATNVEHLDDLFLKGMGGPEDCVNRESELESFPDIYFRIREVLESESGNADRVAQVVSTDVGLSAKLLKLVNSPFYGFPSRIDSISRAVALVGGNELSTLALGISTINYFKNIPKELVDMRSFWRHSISCGIFARVLAAKQQGLQPERFFIGGLLHDVGRLIMFKMLPYACTEAMLFARENSIPLVEAEKTVIGFCHTDVSELLLKQWQFPESLSEMINHHHDPMTRPNALEPAVLHVADNMANAVEVAEGGMYVVPGFKDGAWELLGLPPEYLREAVEQYEDQVDQIMDAFF